MKSPSSESRSRITRDIAIAGFLLVASAVLVRLTPAVISRDTSYRAFGVMLGLFVMFYANEAPKVLPRLDRVRNPAGEQARRRFAGWTITLGGLAYVLTWVLAPVAWAPPISMTLLALSVALSMARCVLIRRGVSSSEPPASILE